jgi:hypothetical protein
MVELLGSMVAAGDVAVTRPEKRGDRAVTDVWSRS